MKIKFDFITNSSNASFIIPKSCLSKAQIALIHNHIEISTMLAKKVKQTVYLDPSWKITETEHAIEGDTSMDNFDMDWFLAKIGVPSDCIEMSGSNYGSY